MVVHIVLPAVLGSKGVVRSRYLISICLGGAAHWFWLGKRASKPMKICCQLR